MFLPTFPRCNILGGPGLPWTGPWGRFWTPFFWDTTHCALRAQYVGVCSDSLDRDVLHPCPTSKRGECVRECWECLCVGEPWLEFYYETVRVKGTEKLISIITQRDSNWTSNVPNTWFEFSIRWFSTSWSWLNNWQRGWLGGWAGCGGSNWIVDGWWLMTMLVCRVAHKNRILTVLHCSYVPKMWHPWMTGTCMFTSFVLFKTI